VEDATVTCNPREGRRAEEGGRAAGGGRSMGRFRAGRPVALCG
jgi:hypothetical protein